MDTLHYHYAILEHLGTGAASNEGMRSIHTVATKVDLKEIP